MSQITETPAHLERPAPPPVARGAAGTRWLALGRLLAPTLVFAALGGLLVLGHRTGWQFPKFSELTGSTKPPDDWCAEHNVMDSKCVECQPGLLPRPKAPGWCAEHGVHVCPLCHPDAAQLRTTPTVGPADLDRAKRALAAAERPENNSACKLHLRRIQFASDDVADKAGVFAQPATLAPMIEAVHASGELDYDPTVTARLSVRVAGTVWRVLKQLGDPVKAGDVLALVDAAEVGKAKVEYLQAHAQVGLKTDALKSLQGSGAGIAPARLREAEAAVQEAAIRLLSARQVLANLGLPLPAGDFPGVTTDALAQRLQFLGLPDALAKTLHPATATANLIAVTAPLDGVVVAREALAGDVVDTTRVLFVVSDVRRLWLTLDLRLEDGAAVAVGQPVRFKADGVKAEAAGTVAWVSTAADHKTRTLKARVTLDNADGKFKAKTFGSGRVILREEKQAVVVPNEAVHWEGDCHIVFVKDKDYSKDGHPKVFYTRTVRLGAKNALYTEVIAGVLPDEFVATTGSAVLRAELLRGSLGEG